MGRHFFVAYGEDSDFVCSLCKKQFDNGFQCENDKKLILCQKCQDRFDMKRCKHDKLGEHRHVKFERRTEEED